VAGDSDDAVIKATEEATALRRSQGGPVVLRYRNNQPVMEPATPPKPKPENPVPTASAPQPSDNQLLQPLPENEQPGAAPNNAPNGAPSQPPAAQPNQGNAPANSGGGLLMPLPDNQQPPAAQQPSQSAPQSQPQQQNNVPRPPQSQSQPQQPVVHRPPQAQQTPAPANSNGGILMPLPDDQQPAAAKQPQQ
jgi:hypothetical protein